MNSNKIFKGVGVAIITPFDNNNNIDYKALEKLLDQFSKDNVDFLCVLGTTAETPCLSNEEKNKVIRFIVDYTKGYFPIVLGCGGNNTASVVNYLKTANLKGIDGVLIVCPYYNKPSQEGLYQHFKTISEASPVPVVLYNVPGRTGVNLNAQTTLRIANDCSNVVAIKEASGNLKQIDEIIKHKPSQFKVISGDDAITCELIKMGAEGVISVICNAYPKEFSEMVHAQLEKRDSVAEKINKDFEKFYPLMGVDGNPAGVKSLLSIQSKIKNVLRLPLVPASKNTQSKLKQAMENTF